jgi:uncharacterized protein YdcH (DUF465 family)
MAEPVDFTLQLLRGMDAKLDRLVDDMKDVKVRISSIEENMAVVSRRLDRLETRMDRVEVRLGLIEPTH